MTDWNAIQAFMANVVAWPGQQDPGHVNLHYSMVNPKPVANKPLLKGMGWPFRDSQSLISRAAWIATTSQFKDAWFCTSLQSKTGTNSHGKVKAVRLAANALLQKSIWVDIDVEPNDPKHYGSVQEALAAVLRFQKVAGLPSPSAIVFSGGGLHVYWISKTPLLPADWHGYAHGLKQMLLANNILCDTGLTTDIARILRVPGTFNHKYDPPKPVELSPLPLVMYDFAKDLAFLKSFAPPLAPTTAPKLNSIFADDADMASFKLPPVFKFDEPDLNAGLQHEEVLLKAEPIFKQCGFFKEALLQGGAKFDQTLWMYSVLGSTFMENGNAIAHAISKGHAAYSEADTQTLYDRKMAERTDRGIGYPSCATIKGAGCKSCETCPLFAKGKSPLNIRPEPVVTAAVNPAVQSPAAVAAGLPEGYELNNNGIICRVVEKADKQGNINTTMVPLFQCVMSEFWLQKHPGEHLNFTMTVDKGFTEKATIDLGEISKQSLLAYLGQKRVLVHPDADARMVGGFFLSMIGKLREIAAAQQSVPFGWYEEKGVRRGFVYGGQIMTDDGVERPCGSVDPAISSKYTPVGTIEKWFEGAEAITKRHRPELNAIMLMSFMSPLIALNGKSAIMMSAWGTDTGAGKSSAYKVGMSVWGHPILTKGTEDQTINNITTTMKTIRHLPFYWDEITDDAHRERVAKVMHSAEGGKEKGRNKDGTTMQMDGMWKLGVVAASNGSFREYLQTRNQNHAASLVRVLEWEVKRIDGGPGFLANADAELLLDQLERNYGQMGLRYAKYLAMNHARITEECRLKHIEVEAAVQGKGAERFWTAGVALMIQAAKYARDCGVDVDPVAMETFMYKVYAENVQAREEFASGGHVDNSETVLTRYLKNRDNKEQGIWTNYMHNTQGRPPKPVVILKGPTQPKNTSGGIEFRFAVENRILVIAKTDFNEYLEEKKHAKTQVYSALREVYRVGKAQKLQICGGWVKNAGREECLVLHITPDTPLWTYMTTYTPPEEKVKLEEGATVTHAPVETGLDLGAHQGSHPTPASFERDAATGLATAASVQAFVQGAARG